ncbi:DUF309 domain-containing protein [Risungbinella massiliensis]|uniref:DUF309 domain-containing protein n=1 Tax=Risungbinella massiliensis TaxID=1329796 RepID=UPI0005CC321E|nr:DUF309 domain-containing protein [Risungbinella massiliensis]
MSSYPEQYLAFFYHFHTTRDYFECHEVLEDLWLECGRDIFYQGLLQVAVALYHHRNGNVGGARKMLLAAKRKLALYPSTWEGVDLADLLSKIEQYQDQMENGKIDLDDAPWNSFRLVLDNQLIQQIKEQFPEYS